MSPRGTVSRAVTAILLLATWAGLAGAEEPAASPAERFGLGGFREAVVSVWDLDRSVETLTSVAGWKIHTRAAVSAEEARFWGLTPAGSGPVGESVLLHNPGTSTGFVRLVRFGQPGEPIRPGAQPWDTGGIFDLNVRALEVGQRMAELRRRGWSSWGEPVRLEFGPFTVNEVLARGPDDLVLAMIERLEPPLTGWPHLTKLSRVFNSTQTVRDFDAALRFYREGLGFEVYLEHEGASEKAGANVLGLPHEVTVEVPRRVAILSPDGSNEGSIEILSFEGASGVDHAKRAVAPNLGCLSLRFPVRDLEAFRIWLSERSIEPAGGPARFELPPYGEIAAFAVTTPEGARLEFFAE